MIKRMRQLPGEEDEAFLLRAELELEEFLAQDKVSSFYFDVQDLARSLVAAALDAFDKPRGRRSGIETLRSFLVISDGELEGDLKGVVEELDADNRRALLIARRMLRAQQDLANGADAIAQSAYVLVNQLAMELLREGGDQPPG